MNPVDVGNIISINDIRKSNAVEYRHLGCIIFHLVVYLCFMSYFIGLSKF